MASTSEIRRRIGGVRQTQKITHAMYLISQAKLRKAKQDLDNTRPYFQALQTEIGRVFNADSTIESRYVDPVDPNAKHLPGVPACLLITADKGLAGAYNQNAIREAEKLLADHPDTKLFVVGEYGRRYFEAHGIPVEHSFLYTAQNPTMQRAREIAAILLDLYDRGRVEKIYVVYTDMKNGLVAEPKQTRLLPFHRAQFFSDTAERAVSVPFEFTPSVGAVLDNVIASYVSGFIYSALVDSFCCEQNARMRAMDSANRNAEKILADLTMAYNRVRQSAITQEITEVSAGAKAQRLAARTKETKEAVADAYR